MIFKISHLKSPIMLTMLQELHWDSCVTHNPYLLLLVQRIRSFRPFGGSFFKRTRSAWSV